MTVESVGGHISLAARARSCNDAHYLGEGNEGHSPSAYSSTCQGEHAPQRAQWLRNQKPRLVGRRREENGGRGFEKEVHFGGVVDDAGKHDMIPHSLREDGTAVDPLVQKLERLVRLEPGGDLSVLAVRDRRRAEAIEIPLLASAWGAETGVVARRRWQRFPKLSPLERNLQAADFWRQ